MQVEVDNAEAYMYDGECLAKAEELGKPGLVTIKQRQVLLPCACAAILLNRLCRSGHTSPSEPLHSAWLLTTFRTSAVHACMSAGC